MLSRTSAVFVILVSDVLCTGAKASITAFWQPVTITPAAISNDPALANMQCWDLMVTASGNWASAGMRAELNAGFFFYKHPLGGLKRPSPAAIAGAPGLEFTTYVNTPNDNGVNNANTLLAGGFPGGVESLGDITAPEPGTFSINWGDLFVDPPDTYQIARLTFPLGQFPDVLTPDQSGNPSFVAQVGPNLIMPIPDIPEPATIPCIGLLALLLRHRTGIEELL
jgi:hypothetical protein